MLGGVGTLVVARVGGVIGHFLAILFLGVLLAGCAAVGGAYEGDPDATADPLEAINRPIFAFNEVTDTLVLRPVSVVYRKWVPIPVKNNVRNVLEWLSLPLTFVHDILQGETERAEAAAARFVTNAMTVGLGDPASQLGHPPYHREDAGQTIATWGVEDGGPYLVLPILGPSNVRDAIGTVADFLVDPAGLTGTRVAVGRKVSEAVDWRARNMEEIDDFRRTSIDYYAGVRSMYRQRRQIDIRNGEFDMLQPAPVLGMGLDFFEYGRAQTTE